MQWFFLALALMLLLTVLPKTKTRSQAAIPKQLPVRTKPYFFSRSERELFEQLLIILPSHQFRVFPNVRISDLFTIEASGAKARATYGRMQEKHVDFLVVKLPEHRPVLGIELDGPSHTAAAQQYRDAVKNVIFESAGLPLLRLSTKRQFTSAQLAALLAPLLSRR
ncbi:hypothetical protein Dxin01_00840 [Deinococcus xinjiangensis]|uniref:DUF2726 domain-containing protein n=1 Tax=Deinococcus xinjiangensis TaxID=457454 RepID=A0ABP9V752_9DEIO